MLSKKIINDLNAQLNLEFFSSNLYLQMSAWCEKKGFPGAAQFLLVHADEEMQHMRRLFTYLTETGALAVIGKIEAPQSDFASLKEIFELTYEHEKLVTSKINELVETTFQERKTTPLSTSCSGMLQNSMKKKNCLVAFWISLIWLALTVVAYIILMAIWAY